MKNNTKNMRKGITAILFAVIMMVSVLAVVSPVQATSGALYAGGSNPGYVYKYTGGTSWGVISSDLDYAVLDLVEYDGDLYAATMSTDDPMSGVGKVWRYDGGTTWALVGDNMDDQVCSLAVYDGNLYAGTAWGDMNLYRYEGGTAWTQVVSYTPWSGTRALYVSHGYLLMGGIGYDRFGRWDGTTFHADLDGGGWCNYDYEDYNGNVFASAYQGRMWESSGAIIWSVVLGYNYTKGNLWELEEFQCELYMSYNNGELMKSSVPDRGTVVYTAPDGIISMTTDGDNLYFGTGGEAGALYDSETTGIASVYKYDGTNVVLISDTDEMVTGVQVLYYSPQSPLWHEINEELVSLKGNVSNANMPNIIRQRLIDKLEYAKELKDNAHEECEAGNFDGATKKLGVAKNQVESFASMVEITRRISAAARASFLADATEIIGKIDRLIEYIETRQKC